MKIGISTASFFLREECEDAMAKINRLGADCAEIFLGTYYEYRPEFSKAHVKDLGGLEVSAVHSLSTNFEPQLFSQSRRVRGDGFYWLDQLMRSAQLLGAKKYTFHGYVSHGMSSDVGGYTAERFNEICEFCSRYGVDVCLENVAWAAYARPGYFKQIKRLCGRLGGVLDIKQARRSGYPLNMYIEDMAGSISHVHVSDIDENGKMCLPGKGIYNFPEIFSRLKDAGFDGPVIIEVYGDNYGDYSELQASLDFLRQAAAKA